MPQTPSTRWCPTPEQLMILEEMYRSGVRTPNAAEIQQITAHLAYYGRIEGKNVFYWFQNHKARERQRLRRRLCARHQQQYAQQQQQQATAAAPSSSPLPSPAAGGSSAGVHPAVMQLHQHHHPYATNFVPHLVRNFNCSRSSIILAKNLQSINFNFAEACYNCMLDNVSICPYVNQSIIRATWDSRRRLFRQC
jgi:hypothetical protein